MAYGGANPSLPTFVAEIAQLVEHSHGKGKVKSSSLFLGSRLIFKIIMAKKNPFVKLQCQECKRINYFTRKSKMLNKKAKLELKKFCKWCKKHTLHKEIK